MYMTYRLLYITLYVIYFMINLILLHVTVRGFGGYCVFLSYIALCSILNTIILNFNVKRLSLCRTQKDTETSVTFL